MLIHLCNHNPVERLLHEAISCICGIDSCKIHIFDRGWEILIKFDDAKSVRIDLVAKISLNLCVELLQYREESFELFAQFDQDHGEIRIPYKDIEPAMYYAACVQDNDRFTVLDTVTT